METAATAPPAPVLNELALRRPEFVEGVTITLSDGQAWAFPLPVVVDYYPRRGPDGKAYVSQGFDLGPVYDDLLEQYVAAEDPATELAVLAALAFELLARNYTLTFQDLRHLLRIKPPGHPEREANNAMWGAVADTVVGVAPKPSPVGSSSP